LMRLPSNSTGDPDRHSAGASPPKNSTLYYWKQVTHTPLETAQLFSLNRVRAPRTGDLSRVSRLRPAMPGLPNNPSGRVDRSNAGQEYVDHESSWYAACGGPAHGPVAPPHEGLFSSLPGPRSRQALRGVRARRAILSCSTRGHDDPNRPPIQRTQCHLLIQPRIGDRVPAYWPLQKSLERIMHRPVLRGYAVVW
jgi:hypothetical protein